MGAPNILLNGFADHKWIVLLGLARRSHNAGLI
jgi:hypothetical protein